MTSNINIRESVNSIIKENKNEKYKSNLRLTQKI